jgi:hypothetical protein
MTLLFFSVCMMLLRALIVALAFVSSFVATILVGWFGIGYGLGLTAFANPNNGSLFVVGNADPFLVC